MINSGAIIVKKGDWSYSFLQSWWNHADRRTHSEQTQFDLLYQSGASRYKDHIVILPPSAINSDPPSLTNYNEKHQVLHLMGENSVFRSRVFSSAWGELCAYARAKKQGVSPSPRMPHQLGISPAKFRQYSFDVYSIALAHSLSSYSERSRMGDILSFKLTHALFNDYMHFVDSSVHIHTTGTVTATATAGKNPIEILVDLMMKGEPTSHPSIPLPQNSLHLHHIIMELLVTNVNRMRDVGAANACQKEGFADFPDVLNLVAQAARAMTQNPLLTGAEKRKLANDALALVQELRGLRLEDHATLVDRYVSFVYLTLGFIEYSEGKLQAALPFLHKSIEINSDLANVFGGHVHSQLFPLLANIYAQLKNYKMAIEFFEKSLALAESRMGRIHSTVGDIYFNYGVALYEKEDYWAARRMLVKCTDIYSKQMTPLSDPAYSRCLNLLKIIKDKLL